MAQNYIASQFIGVVRSATTHQILAVINPDQDSELDNPRWLLIKGETDAVELIRVPRDRYMQTLSLIEVHALVEELKRAG